MKSILQELLSNGNPGEFDDKCERKTNKLRDHQGDAEENQIIIVPSCIKTVNERVAMLLKSQKIKVFIKLHIRFHTKLTK